MPTSNVSLDCYYTAKSLDPINMSCHILSGGEGGGLQSPQLPPLRLLTLVTLRNVCMYLILFLLSTACNRACAAGQMKCTGFGRNACCNWYDNGICTDICPSNFQGDPTTFDCGKFDYY